MKPAPVRKPAAPRKGAAAPAPKAAVAPKPAIAPKPAAAPKDKAAAPKEKAAPPANSLFRPESLEARRTQAFGTVLLQPQISQSWFAYGSLAAVAAVLALLTFCQYSRKAHVNGWIASTAGVLRVFAPQQGVATKVLVHEGDVVAKGAPLIRISGELHTGEGLGARGEAVARIGDREAIWRDARDAHGRLFDSQATEINARLEAIRAEEAHLKTEASMQRARVEIATRTQQRMREMRKLDLVALPRLEQAEQDRLDLAMRLENVEQRRLALAREREQIEAAARDLPMRRKLQVGEVDRNISTTAQEMADAQARREITVTAPEAGVATGLQVVAGGAVNAAAPLMSIVPEGAEFEAHLFVPSRSVGFVKPGQRVQLRYQAYPYQKFGSYEGTVASVSRSPTGPAEMPQALSGLTSLTGVNEAVYLVTVKLARQSAQAYGEPQPLRPGMQLEADVQLDSRRLIEWVLDPLYSLTGSWR